MDKRVMANLSAFGLVATMLIEHTKKIAELESGMNPKDVTVPAYLPDDEVVRKDMCDYYYEVQRFDQRTWQNAHSNRGER